MTQPILGAFFENNVEQINRWREEQFHKGLNTGKKEGLKEGTLNTARLLLSSQAVAELEQIEDIDHLQQRYNEMLTEAGLVRN